MKLTPSGVTSGTVGAAIIALLWTALGCYATPPPQGSQNPSGQNQLMSEQYFKNVQVLRGIPVDEFMGTMGFIAAATGMNCTDCHVEDSGGNWAKYADDTPVKGTARKMMLMMNAINQNFFGGTRNVTCYSCHRGVRMVKVIPNLTEQYAVPPPLDPDRVGIPPPGTPSADAIFAKYLRALGGIQRLEAISSFTAKGTYQGYDDPEKYPIDVYAKAPNQRTVVMHTLDGDNTTTVGGDAAWTAAPLTDYPTAVLDLTGQLLDGVKFDANLSFPSRIKDALSDWRVGPLTTVDGHDVRIVQGTSASGAIVKLYFDPLSGLLLRQLRTANTPIGAILTQVDYADYRDVVGVGIKMPFRWTVTWTDGRTIFRIAEVKTNVKIDPAKFGEPAPSVPPAKSAAR